MSPVDHRFSCTLCGDCCTGAQTVRLTGADLQRLVRHLGLTSVSELRTQGLVSLVHESLGNGHSVWRPRIRFRTKPLRQCPFLLNDVGETGRYRGLCRLHPHDKPLVCQLSPLSRDVEDPGQGPVAESWSFVPPVDGCPGVGRGDLVPLEAPLALKDSLAEEVAWMRYLMDGSSGCPDEEAAWSLLLKAEG